MTEKNKVSIIIQAIDKATSVVRSINGTIGKMAAPARATSRSLDGLFKATGYKRVEKAAEGVGKQFRGLAATGAMATGAAAGMFYALTRVTNAGENATKAARQFGTTVPEWQKLEYAADGAGVNTDALGKSLGALNKNAVAAATGNQQAAQWFRRAGINVRDQNGHVKSSTQLMGELSDQFEKMPDGPKKLALAEGLLKDSSKEMIEFLNGGSQSMRAAGAEAEALGLVNEKLARDSAAFNSELKKTKSAATGVGNALASGILPALTAFLPGIRAWIVSNRELVATTARDLFEGLLNVGAVIWQMLRAVNAVVQVFGGWKSVIYVLAAFLGAKMVFAVLALAKSFLVLGAAMLATPIGWIMILATLATVIIANWDKVKAWFLDFIDSVLKPVHDMMEKIGGLVPDFVKTTNSANALGPAAPSAISPGAARAGTAQVGGTIKVEFDDKGRPRVKEMRSDNPGVDFNVSSGFASAGGY